MFVKIYFNNKPLFLANNIDEEIKPFTTHDDTVIIDEFSAPAINSMIHEMKQDKIHAGVLIHNDLEELKLKVFKKFIIVTAAGGLVYNDQGNILMIFRRGQWDLPKGKLDTDETIEECARREVMEETGLKTVTVEKPLIITYHTYDESGHHILKDSHWYTMKAGGNEELTPQTEEQITAIKWVSPEEISEYAKNTFPSIKDVLIAAGLLN